MCVFACVAGSTVYTCMLNKMGGVEADLTVSRLEPGAANLPLAPQADGEKRTLCAVAFDPLSGFPPFIFPTLFCFITSWIYLWLFAYFVLFILPSSCLSILCAAFNHFLSLNFSCLYISQCICCSVCVNVLVEFYLCGPEAQIAKVWRPLSLNPQKSLLIGKTLLSRGHLDRTDHWNDHT